MFCSLGMPPPPPPPQQHAPQEDSPGSPKKKKDVKKKFKLEPHEDQLFLDGNEVSAAPRGFYTVPPLP